MGLEGRGGTLRVTHRKQAAGGEEHRVVEKGGVSTPSSQKATPEIEAVGRRRHSKG